MSTTSVSIAAASVEGLVLGRRRQRDVVAGHVGEAAMVDAVGELGLAGRELLVAAGGQREGVAGRHRLAHRLPKLEGVRAVALYFHGAPGIGAGGERELAAGEPAA